MILKISDLRIVRDETASNIAGQDRFDIESIPTGEVYLESLPRKSADRILAEFLREMQGAPLGISDSNAPRIFDSLGLRESESNSEFRQGAIELLSDIDGQLESILGDVLAFGRDEKRRNRRKPSKFARSLEKLENAIRDILIEELPETETEAICLPGKSGTQPIGSLRAES